MQIVTGIIGESILIKLKNKIILYKLNSLQKTEPKAFKNRKKRLK